MKIILLVLFITIALAQFNLPDLGKIGETIKKQVVNAEQQIQILTKEEIQIAEKTINEAIEKINEVANNSPSETQSQVKKDAPKAEIMISGYPNAASSAQSKSPEAIATVTQTSEITQKVIDQPQQAKKEEPKEPRKEHERKKEQKKDGKKQSKQSEDIQSERKERHEKKQIKDHHKYTQEQIEKRRQERKQKIQQKEERMKKYQNTKEEKNEEKSEDKVKIIGNIVDLIDKQEPKNVESSESQKMLITESFGQAKFSINYPR